MATVTTSASLITRKTTSTGNALSGYAGQEYYDPSSNLVGVIHFSGLDLSGKVITGVSLTCSSLQSGYGAWKQKTVYWRESVYQEPARSGVTGAGYAGSLLGTFTGSFYNNTTTVTLSGEALSATIAYLADGNNTFTIYNPNPVQSDQGYANDYFIWDAVTLTVTYEESASTPTVSSSTVAMGSSVTISTNRLSTSATHTLTYTIGSTTGNIATNVGDSVSWTPPVSLAALIPSATSCACTITCVTYYNGTAAGSRTCSLTLTVPASVAPVITAVTLTEATPGIAAQFACYVQSKSALAVSITASGAQGSTISSYRTVIGGATYTAASFTSNVLSASGAVAVSVTVTDSRGRTATSSQNITVAPYAIPSITALQAERCNASGTQPQPDGNKIRISCEGSVSPVNNRNTISMVIWYKLSSASSWTQAKTLTASNFSVSVTNTLLSQTFNALNSYDIKAALTDAFTTVEQVVTVSTKQVVMDLYRDGTGIAFGKVAETSGYAEFGWPLKLASPLSIAQGGTGQATAAAARNALGLGNTTGALPVANGGTGQTTVAAARNALGLGNTSGAVPVANGGTGAASAADARANLGITLANLGAAASTHNHAAENITSGTLSAARLPFKFAMGSTTVNSAAGVALDYSAAGFTSVPKVFVMYSTADANWSGTNGTLKVYNKTTSGCYVVVGGTYTNFRGIDWFAIGT